MGKTTGLDEEYEARRLKTLAENLYNDSNLKSALKYAIRAQQQCKDLDGVSELVMALTILQTAAKPPETGGSQDWYRVLQVEPFSHINTIKKQYRKLALLLHPDKNSFVASEEAFKLVGDAFRCLSDKVQRKEYDTKLRNAIQAEAAVTDIDTEEKFWTACSKCRFSCRFERRYIGHSLMCPSCKKSFVAVEVDANEVDCDDIRVRDLVRAGSSRLMKSTVGDRLGKTDSKRKICSDNEVIARSTSISVERLEKKDMNGVGGGDLSESLSSKRGRIGGERTLAEMQLDAKQKVLREKMKVKSIEDKEKIIEKGKEKIIEKGKEKVKSIEGKKKSIEKEKEKERSRDHLKHTEIPIIDKRSALKKRRSLEVESPIRVVSKKSKDLVTETQGVASKKKGRNVEVEISQALTKSGSSRTRSRASKKNVSSMEIQTSRAMNGGGLEMMTVEDSDFYDFDTDRVERSFKQGQVWAVYDDDDGMPRLYGLIDEPVLFNPFELKMSWLDLQDIGDHDLLCREKLGFHIACGRFKVSKKTVIDSVNSFSHIVDCERVAREIYRIYPKKGSIWALYKEDVEGGTCFFSKDGTRCYDIVVFLTSYSEMHGVSVAYLEKANGFKTVFKRREIGAHAVRWFEKDDVRLFSHQIPARKLSGAEVPKSLGDCWELDPASLSKELLTLSNELLRITNDR